MSAQRILYLAVAAAFAVQPVLAEDAKRREGSSGSSGSAGSRHHSGSSGSSSSGSRSGSSHASHSSGSSSRSGVTLTDAQRRHPRAGTGTGWRDHYYRGGYYGSPYYGGYYGGYYGRYPYYGYRPYYSWGYGYYPYSGLYFDSWAFGAPYYGYGTYVRSSADTGAIRVLVGEPNVRVYVDGYYAGIVDDFDGMFQRLYVSPGQHDITLKLEGYKTHNFSAHVPYDGTLKLRWQMERGEGHDGTGDPTLAPPRREARYAREERDDEAESREAERDDRDADRAERPHGEPVGQGSVRFEVRPSDASIYVDGKFRGTGRDLRSLELRAGTHKVEIVMPGYRTYERDVTVDAADFVDLSVELEK